jgi:hypothetical protein
MPIPQAFAARVFAVVLLAGALGVVPTRPASAHQDFNFSQTFALNEINLDSIDAFGAYWRFFSGGLHLDTSASIDSHGNGLGFVWGNGSGSGLNYKLGTSGRLEIFFWEFVSFHRDPVDGTPRGRIPFSLALRGEGGGEIPSVMHLALTPQGVFVLGITRADDPLNGWLP